MRQFALLSICFLVFACGDAPVEECVECPPEIAVSQDAEMSNTPEQPEESKYPGTYLDEKFPIVSHISAIDGNGAEDIAELNVADYSVTVTNYIPRSLIKNGKDVYTFKKREDDAYLGTAVGTSSLAGKSAKEIYVAVLGPGGVCCTNYSIIDVSSPTPRSIFHSEDFGSFRDPMEIFDAEGDGVYEIVQFDSCFRYFMDDCGSCSPEPRAYFNFDPRLKRYLPARGLLQDFVRDELAKTDKWILEKSTELKQTGNLNYDADFRRVVLSHVADLLHTGEDAQAWQVFNEYYDDPDGAARKEIKSRLAACRFYQALRKISKNRRTRKTV